MNLESHMSVIWGPYEIPVCTAKGTRIPNERPAVPKAPHIVRESSKLVQKSHPTAVPRSFGSTYNCAGLVLAFRRTFIDDLPGVPVWLAEDGYRLLPVGEPPCAGDVVVYKSATGGIEHLGIILERASDDALGAAAGHLIMSKWGFFGEYIHRVMDKPASLGRDVEYWTERT
jgi:hypothetical protein